MIYLAGPFFNATQLRLIKSIEAQLAESDMEFISPRSQHGEEPTPITSNLQAKSVYLRNVKDLLACSSVLAVMDYLLPDSMTLWLTDLGAPGKFRGPISLPDTGTVWEMGYAVAIGKPVVLFISNPNETPVNIMLSQCAVGVLNGMDELKAWCSSYPKPYQGRHT